MPIYPAQIDTNTTLPAVTDNFTPVMGSVYNKLREAVIAIETELGVNPKSVYTTVRARLDILEGLIGSANRIELRGDLGGTYHDPLVIGLYGRPVASTAPTTYYVLTWNGLAWEPAAPTGLPGPIGPVGPTGPTGPAGSAVPHNELEGIQGGNYIDGYYHLTSQEYNWLLDGYNDGYWTESKGGTGQNTYLPGDLLYGSSYIAGTLDRLPIGNDGYVLIVNSGIPSWGEYSSIIDPTIAYSHLESNGVTWVEVSDITLPTVEDGITRTITLADKITEGPIGYLLIKGGQSIEPNWGSTGGELRLYGGDGYVGAGETAWGGKVSIKGGTGDGIYGVGGSIEIYAGSGPNGGGSVEIVGGYGSVSYTGGDVTLRSGDGNESYASGNVYLNIGYGVPYGNIYFGVENGTNETDYQIFANTGSVDSAGIRYNKLTDTWELRAEGVGSPASWSSIAFGSLVANHNDLLNIQGGSGIDGYYHLTATQHTALTSSGSTTLHTHAHNNLTSIQGGSGVDGYYHLTATQHDLLTTSFSKVDGYLTFTDGYNPSGVTLNEIAAPSAYIYEFTNANLSAGILTVSHGLNNQYVIVDVYNNSNKKIIPDDITVTDSNNCSIDLSTFGTLTGTWHAVISVGGISATTQNRYTPIDSNTMIQWKFNETSAPWANTGVSGSLDLTVEGVTTNPISIVGLFGNAIATASTVLTSSPTTIGEPTGQAFTTSLWIKPFVVESGIVLVKSLNPNNWVAEYAMFIIATNNDGTWTTYLKTTGNPTYSLQAITNRAHYLRSGIASFLSVTYDGSYLRMYHNASLAKEVAWTGDVVPESHGEWQIGGVLLGATGPTSYITAHIEDIRVENVCRSQSYLETQYRAGLSLWI